MCDINKFYETKLDKFIKICYKSLRDEINIPQFKKHNNPLDDEEECFLINDKKDTYYKYSYEPNRLIENAIKYNLNNNFIINEEFRQQYIKYIKDIMDLEPKQNCCNCVSFTLYTPLLTNIAELEQAINNNDEDDIDDIYENVHYSIEQLYKYLCSLQQSIININNKLKDFVVRLYLDISVIEAVNKFDQINTKKEERKEKKELFEFYKRNIIDKLHFIFNATNVEIYTYLCKSFSVNKARTRALRFLPLIDSEVNISIIREADGIVSYTDIYNIKKFVESNKLIFIYNFNVTNFIDSTITQYLLDYVKTNIQPKYTYKDTDIVINITNRPYTVWLQEYTSNTETYKGHKTLFDLLAGIVGFGIKITVDTFKKHSQIVHANITRINKDHRPDKLSIGFDEILLLELFKNLYSYKIDYFNIEELTPSMIAEILFILNNFHYPINKYDISNNYMIVNNNNNSNDKIGYILNDKPKKYKHLIDDIIHILHTYIYDYYIEDIIKSSNINDSCIEIVNTTKNNLRDCDVTSNILNRFIAIIPSIISHGDDKKNLELINLYKEHKISVKHLDHYIMTIINNLYDNKMYEQSYVQKYLKYKQKYMSLKLQYDNYKKN